MMSCNTGNIKSFRTEKGLIHLLINYIMQFVFWAHTNCEQNGLHTYYLFGQIVVYMYANPSIFLVFGYLFSNTLSKTHQSEH